MPSLSSFFRMKVFFSAMILALTAIQATASEQDGALISSLEIRPNGVVIVIMYAPRVTTGVSCVDQTWHKTHWAFSPATHTLFDEYLSVFLAAKSAGRPVRIIGNGTCNAIASIETVESITVR